MPRLRAIVARGRATGSIPTPHRYPDGGYIVSLSRHQRDYIRVTDELALAYWLAQGYAARMSDPSDFSRRPPSLIQAASIRHKAKRPHFGSDAVRR